MLGAVLLHTINYRMVAPGAAAAPQYLTWGYQVVGTSMLAVVIQAPFASLIMRFVGPRCLEQVRPAQPPAFRCCGGLRRPVHSLPPAVAICAGLPNITMTKILEPPSLSNAAAQRSAASFCQERATLAKGLRPDTQRSA